MPLNSGQQLAFDTFKVFFDQPEGDGHRLMALLGYAGTGKTFTANTLIKHAMEHSRGEILILAPTHKAIGVVRANLDEVGVQYEKGYDNYRHRSGTPVTATTASALGIGPDISENQDETSQQFKRSGRGFIGKLQSAAKNGAAPISLVIVDEVSMLSEDDLQHLEAEAELGGFRILVIGDPGQLPPVNAEEIKWDEIAVKVTLEEIMRQTGDSMIPVLGQAVRNREEWKTIEGPGIVQCLDVVKDFIRAATVPELDESKQTVFVGYTNRLVNETNDAACKRIYGHGRDVFEKDEIVIAGGSLMTSTGQPLCTTSERLEIGQVGGPGQFGTEIDLIKSSGKTFYTEFLTAEEEADPNHRFNITLRAALAEAKKLQNDFAKTKDYRVNELRKTAWKRYFNLQRNTLVSLTHPLAITSHKSQG